MTNESNDGRNTTMKTKSIFIAVLVCALAATAASAQTAPMMKMTTDIPPEILTPDIIKSRIGTLKLFDGYPDDATTQKVYDNLDFQRGVQAFLNAMPGAAVTAFRPALRKLGGVDGNVIIFEQLMDSKALWLTANTTPERSTAVASCSAWARSNVIGLSQMTLKPASTAALAISKCVWLGVATERKSMRSPAGRFNSSSISSR